MSSSPAAAPEPVSPDAIIMQLLFSKIAFFSFAAVAKLGIADHVSETPRDIEDIARDTATHTPSLYRVMRLMVSLGVFTEGPPRHFAINPAGQLLQSGNPRSMRDMAIMFRDPWVLKSYTQLDECIRTGTDGVTLEYGKHMFDLFPEIPEQAANFHRAMTSFSGSAAGALLEVADFSRFRRLCDCGGGHGLLLSRVLGKFTNLHGVVFDLPEVVSGAPAAGHFHGAAERVAFESGSFFERVPEGCDAYIMKHIVHDWDDEGCRRILTLMREELVKHAPETGRVFLCEMVVPDDAAPAPAKMLDIEMLVCTRGGKERTTAEFGKLFESAGLKLVGITPTKSPVCLIEAAVAG
jgi:O-methyltransferase domain